MKIRKLLFFVLIKGYVKVVNMYFLIVTSYEEKLLTNNFVQFYKIHITKSYNGIYYSLKL